MGLHVKRSSHVGFTSIASEAARPLPPSRSLPWELPFTSATAQSGPTADWPVLSPAVQIAAVRLPSRRVDIQTRTGQRLLQAILAQRFATVHGSQLGGLPIEARKASVKARTFALGCDRARNR